MEKAYFECIAQRSWWLHLTDWEQIRGWKSRISTANLHACEVKKTSLRRLKSLSLSVAQNMNEYLRRQTWINMDAPRFHLHPFNLNEIAEKTFKAHHEDWKSVIVSHDLRKKNGVTKRNAITTKSLLKRIFLQPRQTSMKEVLYFFALWIFRLCWKVICIKMLGSGLTSSIVCAKTDKFKASRLWPFSLYIAKHSPKISWLPRWSNT